MHTYLPERFYSRGMQAISGSASLALLSLFGESSSLRRTLARDVSDDSFRLHLRDDDDDYTRQIAVIYSRSDALKEKFLEDASWEVRKSIPMNAESPILINYLAFDKVEKVREAVAKFTPTLSVLENLLSDSSAKVRAAAKDRLCEVQQLSLAAEDNEEAAALS